MTEPLRAFWWNKAPNFGDALSRDVIELVSGRPVTWAPEQTAQVFAVGSIMWNARKGVVKRAEGQAPPVIWGSGCMEAMDGDWCHAARVVALRGPVTAAVLNHTPLPFGDPGLLARRLVGPVEQEDKVGVLLHHSQVTEEALAHLRQGGDRIKIIDVRTNDAKAVIREIASCRQIFSQSLHGIIIADAYGIPNVRIEGADIHRSAQFKFYDYATSIGRAPLLSVKLQEVPELAGQPIHPDSQAPDLPRIDAMAQGLIEAFPQDLKA
ncbi:polysaccharide pyruvyl transferase family protein [Falsirhodobacter sp. 1013]|uniref:polysaccharide pyruvyl transferase family protein n=1 Tax=Falsirhodobacter sp. 1013 TaxID=3417566 RepID=UPI003EBB44B2